MSVRFVYRITNRFGLKIAKLSGEGAAPRLNNRSNLQLAEILLVPCENVDAANILTTKVK